jgi:hypothetical protein
MITLKLFNMVAKEIGPHLLANGVWLRGKAWNSLAKQLSRKQKTPSGIAPQAWVNLTITDTAQTH